MTTLSAPISLSAPSSACTASTILLMWDANPSNQSVTEYEIYRDNVQVGTTQRLSYTVTGLPAATSSVFTVRSKIADGMVSEDSESVEAKTKPAGPVFDVRDYGATGDGVTEDTAAVQKAIDECTPGGTVFLPAGTYLTRQILLKSDMTLDISSGAILQFVGLDETELPFLRSEVTGLEGPVPVACKSLIVAVDVSNLTITGGGTINANGPSWWPHYETVIRPRVMMAINSQNIFVQGIRIEDAPCWNFHFLYVDTAVFSELTIAKVSEEHGCNGDGINPDSCKDVLIVGCTFANQDDSIAIKSGKITKENSSRQRPCENIVVRDCRVDATLAPGSHPLGFAIGSECCGGIRNVLVKNCTFNEAASIVNIKALRERVYGLIENVRVENCTYNNTVWIADCWNKGPICVDLFYSFEEYETKDVAEPLTESTPLFRDIHFKNIKIANATGRVAYLFGFLEQPLKNLTFENVTGTGAQGFYGRNVQSVKLENVQVIAEDGKHFEWINRID